MPNHREFLQPTPQTNDTFLRSRLYPTSGTSPTTVKVHTRAGTTDPQDNRFTCVESVFDGAAVQPHIHDVHIVLKHGRHTSHFRVFFKCHVRLPANPHLLHIRGDLLIMRIASRNAKSVVNMRPSDQKLADFVAARISQNIANFQSQERRPVPPKVNLQRSW
ncbi:hypothetical protein B0H10DRAFT_1969735 [Mycena sp. CBHHK59/15]|nr:hypothetical protein B0H10DRAFT_1969735 [Mycena sp. CBHHK59/15]